MRISLPANLVKKLRQDVKVTIQPALTGMSHVNIVSTGRSNVPLVPGKEPITGVETSFFDPIIEQVGLGPVERNDIRHMIAEARQTVDSVAPRLRQFLAIDPGDDREPPGDERRHPAGRRVDRRPGRGPDPADQRQRARRSSRPWSGSRA